MPMRKFPKISRAQNKVLSGRRRLLQLSATLPVSLPVFSVLCAPKTNITYHLVKNQESAAGVIKGALVLVDSGINVFQTDGFYLYPDWGQPVVYEVRQTANRLAFHYPGNDKVLWVSGPEQSMARFSGRVEGILKAEELDTNKLLNSRLGQLQTLHVPPLPAV